MTDWFTKFGGTSQKENSNNWFSNFGGISEKTQENPPSRGLGAAALRQAGRLGRAAATGIAGLADIPNLGALGLHAAGLKETPTFYEPVAGKVQQGIDTLTGGTLKPENKAEEYVDIISEGLAPMALAPFTGGASLTGTAARGLSKAGVKGADKLAKVGAKTYAPTAANMAQSIGSSAALKSYLDEGGDPGLVGPLLASMAGGIGARGTLSAAKNIARSPTGAIAESIGRATGFSPEKYAKNVEIGLPVSLANTSKSELPSYVELAAAKMPGSMGPLEKFSKKREAAIARNLGVQTPEDLEKAVKEIPKHLAKEGAEGYHSRASNIYKKREEKFKPREEAAIKNKELIDVSDIIDKLEHERNLSLTADAKKRFDKSKEGILLKELKESIPKSVNENKDAELLAQTLRSFGNSEDAINKTVKSTFGEVPQHKEGIGLHDLNKLREKALQESVELKTPTGGGTPESKRAAQRSELLGNKRHQFMEETGTPTQIHNARQARKFWAQYKNKENGIAKYVAKLSGADNDAKSFDKLISDNPKYLRIARQGLDKKGQEQLASGIISDLGSRQGRFNITTAHTNFSKLEDPVKKEFLKTLPNKSAQNNFERTMQLIGEHKRMMEKLANTSNTAHSKHLIDQMKRYGSAGVAAATGYGLTGLLGLTLETAGLYAGAKIWTDQRFLRRVNEAISASNNRGKANKLDMLLKTIEQTGTHMKHIDEGK